MSDQGNPRDRLRGLRDRARVRRAPRLAPGLHRRGARGAAGGKPMIVEPAVYPRSTSVLLLHGLTGMPSEMRPLARHLSRLGYRVETPLLPGHGSTHRELLRTTWRDWLAGARRSLAEIAPDSEAVVLAGLSIGALLAVLLAADEDAGPQVDGIVLLSTTMRYDGSSIPATRVFLPLAHLFPFLGN